MGGCPGGSAGAWFVAGVLGCGAGVDSLLPQPPATTATAKYVHAAIRSFMMGARFVCAPSQVKSGKLEQPALCIFADEVGDGAATVAGAALFHGEFVHVGFDG